MLIDPSQPIIFDTESAPGRGIGYWQMNPRRMYFFDDGQDECDSLQTEETKADRIARRIIFTIVFGGILLAVLHMMLT